LNNLLLGIVGEMGLLIFLALFAGVVIWTFTRPRKEIEHQAHLPVDDDDR